MAKKKVQKTSRKVTKKPAKKLAKKAGKFRRGTIDRKDAVFAILRQAKQK